MKIKRNSPITSLRAAISKDGYSHILSDRRQMFINPEDVKKLPEIIKINFDETIYYVYPTTDAIRCFVCKCEGHVAKQCPSINYNEITVPPQQVNRPEPIALENNANTINSSQTIDSTNDVERSVNIATVPDNSNQLDIFFLTPALNNFENQTSKPNKRPLSLSTTSSSLLRKTDFLSSSQSSLDSFSDEKSTQKHLKTNLDVKSQRNNTKKPKKDSEQLSDIENPENKFPLNYTTLKEFLEKRLLIHLLLKLPKNSPITSRI
ncbi:hypothetical protein TSAR_012248 [Trichomalopsis sarcophagae]|uniref:CCHC-type domain-containing protein n=1 Tax=Trichomalopsis sarcophagae TaxID=543379 RepID=A0A232EVG6_9HYME|nr:hypothetical protein TSAR_012248 [Trichomalopsis sarcophagae]